MAETDRLLEQLTGFLSSPEGMAQLQSAAQMLGLGGQQAGAPTPPQPVNPPPIQTAGPPSGQSDLTSALAAFSGGQQAKLPGGMDPQMLFRIAQMMQAASQETPASRLLRALQPLLREERRSKVDDAIRMMQLFSLLPLLRSGGIQPQ